MRRKKDVANQNKLLNPIIMINRSFSDYTERNLRKVLRISNMAIEKVEKRNLLNQKITKGLIQ